MTQLTDNEFKMMEALAGVCDYVEETSSEMEEMDMGVCKDCKDSNVKVTLENMYYPALQDAMDVYSEMYETYGEEFDTLQHVKGQMIDIEHGRKIGA